MHASWFSLVLALAPAALGAGAVDFDREMILAPHAGEQPEDREIARWQRQAEAPAATAGAFEGLGWAFVAKARRTQDAGFYKLAEKTADVIAARFGAKADARLLRGHALHNLHRFAEAETIARALVAERGVPAELALLSDVLVEQGKLAEGVAVLQRLANVKPGPETLARIAHVRWLKGDLAGASAAMEAAVRMATPQGEAQAWLLVRLSGFCLQAGDVSRALALAGAAGEQVSDYAPALLARGKALLANGKLADAITPLRRAEELNPLPEYQWWLADALRAAKQFAEAERVEARLKARGAASDARTFALFLATRGVDAATAVRLARAEREERADVFTHDALAWALAVSGDFAAAEAAMTAALAEGTKDARLFLHAGEIARAREQRAAAVAFFAQARAAAGTLTPTERALLEQRAEEAAQ